MCLHAVTVDRVYAVALLDVGVFPFFIFFPDLYKAWLASTLNKSELYGLN